MQLQFARRNNHKHGNIRPRLLSSCRAHSLSDSAAAHKLISPRTLAPPGYPSFFCVRTVIKTWDRPRANCLGALEIHSRSSPKSPSMSGSESSLLEGQMRGRPRSCKEFAIRPTVQRSTGLVQRENVRRYVLILSCAFDSTISSSGQVQLDASQEVGNAYSCS